MGAKPSGSRNEVADFPHHLPHQVVEDGWAAAYRNGEVQEAPLQCKVVKLGCGRGRKHLRSDASPQNVDIDYRDPVATTPVSSDPRRCLRPDARQAHEK